MLRIRFHGRGGHGAKTASRIVGSAAFRAGFYVQDSPVYGAERRGAPVTAFTRIDRETILERGMIESPDVIVVADETLLGDPSAGVLVGQDTAAVVFVNAVDGTTTERLDLRPEVQTLDLTRRTLEALGCASTLSAALAGAAARLTGLVSIDHLNAAVRDELTDLGFDRALVERNQRLATDVFEALTPARVRPGRRVLAETEPTGGVHRVEFDRSPGGRPTILSTGNASLRRTGNWRLERPVIDCALCVRCDLCYVLCPDGAISFDEEGYPVIDEVHCKGCMMCLEECPPAAISATREVRSW